MTEISIPHSENELQEPKIPVLMAGLPGKMATLVAEQLVNREGFELLPFSLSSARHDGGIILIGSEKVQLAHAIHQKPAPKDGTIAVDFTTPDSAVSNAQLFADLRIPFVMGTSGGDRRAIEEIVRHSEISAVIAPNMAASVIEIQTMIEALAEKTPNLFNGWRMTIRESHQATKKDVSGTARALQGQLETLGVSMEGEIESIRDPETQRKLGIKSLDGHAYHWINLQSPDGVASMELRTQIEGRAVYVEGTLMAVRFLRKKMQNGSRGEIFSMSDVLSDN